MTRYPQLTSLDIRIDVPAFDGVPSARTGTVLAACTGSVPARRRAGA